MAPTNHDSQQFTIQLPAGTKCTGGTNQDLCLASITTTSGLGNCVVVSQVADVVDTSRSSLNTRQATDVRSEVGKRKRGKRSASADEEGSDPAPAKDDQTSRRKADKRKKRKDKGTIHHNQRITGKRLCKFFMFVAPLYENGFLTCELGSSRLLRLAKHT